MANKKQVQITSKKRLKKRKALNNSERRFEPSLKRRRPLRPQNLVILIVSEGENTEPSYFNQFKIPSVTIKPIGEGYNTTSLVNRAITLADEGNYDEVWCVFDKDDFSAESFNSAISEALRNKFWVAYSNQAFEYWLILHFEDHQGGALHRDHYESKINSYINPLGANYDGSGDKKVSKDLFDLLFDNDPQYHKRRVDLAISRAKRNYERFDHRSPALEESSTKVYELVSKLLDYL